MQEFLQAFRDGVRALKDRYADVHEGAAYDHWAAAGAIIFAREARRDSDLWRAVYIDSAEGKDLTIRLDKYGFERVEDGYGSGTASLTRASASAGAGTIWRGTRIVVGGPLVDAKRYVVSADTAVSATATSASVPIRPESVGVGWEIDVAANDGLTLRVEDPLWDASWAVSALQCSDGTSFESAPAARARFREERLDDRAGFEQAIIDACESAGATHAVLFSSAYAGDAYDFGLNRVYVGDASYSGTTALVNAVAIELENWRVLGDNLQVGPLARAALTIDATVYLWTAPSRVNIAELTTLLRGAAKGYFDGVSDGYSYDLDALAGALLKAAPSVQFVTFTTPSVSVGVVQTVAGLPNLPATLTRYTLRADDIALNFQPPL